MNGQPFGPGRFESEKFFEGIVCLYLKAILYMGVLTWSLSSVNAFFNKTIITYILTIRYLFYTVLV